MKPKKENKKGGAIVLHRGHGLSAWRQSKRFE